jgi:hypothetical protein
LFLTYHSEAIVVYELVRYGLCNLLVNPVLKSRIFEKWNCDRLYVTWESSRGGVSAGKADDGDKRQKICENQL